MFRFAFVANLFFRDRVMIAFALDGIKKIPS
jgi:hypothetical protein